MKTEKIISRLTSVFSNWFPLNRFYKTLWWPTWRT